MTRTIKGTLPLLAVSLLTVMVGCEMFDETTIDPFEGQDRYFAIYGFLDATRVEQEIRVVPVRRTPERILSPTDDNAFIDATVTSTDVETGQSLTWRHELTELSDGTYGHIFRATFAPRAGRSYRIDVVRSDGKSSSAVTSIPLLSSISQPVVGGVYDHVGGIAADVVLPGIYTAAHIVVFYDLNDCGRSHLFRVRRTYGNAGIPEQGGWRFTLDLSRDALEVRRTAEAAVGERLCLNQMGVQVRWADAEWPVYETPIDIEALAQPDGPSNVVNGSGFVGSVGDYLRFWDVEDPELKTALGFL